MRRALSVLSILALWSTPVDAAVLWFSGVETGDLGEFKTTNGGPNATTGITANTGLYSMFVNGTGPVWATSAAGFAATTLFTRVYFQYTAAPSGGNSSILSMENAASSYGLVLGLTQTSGNLFFGNNTISVTATSGVSPSINTWHRLDIKAVVSASVGGMEIKLDGTTVLTSFASDTSGATAIDHIKYGNVSGQGSVYHYDDMMICSSAYCPNGGTIARQGTSGSPTYTAWTKNSCTSSLIENCWSQTPFDATPNATDTVLNDAQTMLVHSFSTTQSGHGTQTMVSVAAINACKAAMVAKAASGGTLSIRRRLNGADTDTAKTVTTSDAYYDDGIWTDTLPHLNSSEIGVKQGANTVSQQVEDMWLMCDYLAATALPRHRVIQK